MESVILAEILSLLSQMISVQTLLCGIGESPKNSDKLRMSKI